jgi:hypothetical protein
MTSETDAKHAEAAKGGLSFFFKSEFFPCSIYNFAN